MAYCSARVVKERKNQVYRAYITDALKSISENTAKYADGSYMKERYIDIVRPKPMENRTSNEIIGSIKAKLARMGGEAFESV